MKDLTGRVQTVLGPVRPADLGITLPHEHVLADFDPSGPSAVEAGRKRFGRQPLAPGIRHHVAMHHDGRDEGKLLDEEEAIAELAAFHRAGGETVVDATNTGTGRDPLALARVSRAAGVHIVMGSGTYLASMLPPEVLAMSEGALAEAIVHDIEEGFGWPPVRAGIIGEIASGWPIDPTEEKGLRAAAAAQCRTGAPLLIHPGRDARAPFEIVRIIIDAGGDPARTAISHLERTIFDRAVLEDLARTGCFIEYDLFGQETAHYGARPDVFMPNDARRLDDLAWLIERGHREQILVSHDVGSRELLRRYGGHGYSHIIDNVVPMMLRKGFTEDHVETIVVRNPARFLTFAAPIA